MNANSVILLAWILFEHFDWSECFASMIVKINCSFHFLNEILSVLYLIQSEKFNKIALMHANPEFDFDVIDSFSARLFTWHNLFNVFDTVLKCVYSQELGIKYY